MKKSLLALATLCAFAGAANAQSSVTLFGLVDLSLNSVKNGANTTKTMDSNMLNSNRLAGWFQLPASFDRQPVGQLRRNPPGP
jgi:predicted porin